MPSNIASLANTARARLIAALTNPLIQAEADDANVTVAFGTPKVVAVDGKKHIDYIYFHAHYYG